MKTLSKKSQVVIFAIAGIAILLSVALFSYFKVENSDIGLENQNDERESLLPLYNFVEENVREITLQELNLIGQLGGFVNQDYSVEYNFEYPAFNYGGVSLQPWDSNNYPKKSYIENYLSQIITSKMEEIFDASYFSERYDIAELSDFVIMVSIKNDKINVLANKRLNVTSLKDGSSYYLDKFNVDVSTDFGNVLFEAYRVYDELLNESLKDKFASQVLYSGAFPMEGIFFNCDTEYYSIQNLKEEYDDISKTHFDYLTYDYILDGYKEDSEAAARRIEGYDGFEDYDYYKTFAISNPKFQTFSMEIDTLDSISFNSKPNSGGYVKPFNSVGLLKTGTFCMNIFHQFYSLKQPIVVRIENTESNTFFNLPLMVDILNNDPGMYNKIVDFNKKYVSNDEFCSLTTDNQYTFEVHDSSNYETLDNVSIDLVCLGSHICPAGYTDSVAGNFYDLTTKIVDCDRYRIILEKEGYESTQYFVEKPDDSIFDLSMNRLVNVTANVIFNTLDRSDNSVSNNFKTWINSNENLNLLLKDSNGINSYSYSFNSTDRKDGLVSKEIQIPYKEGLYQVDIVFSNSNSEPEYLGRHILNVSFEDFSMEESALNLVEIPIYGFKNYDTTNDQEVLSLFNYYTREDNFKMINIK